MLEALEPFKDGYTAVIESSRFVFLVFSLNPGKMGPNQGLSIIVTVDVSEALCNC